MNEQPSKISRNTWRLIIVAALGYFVDIYDLILFNVVKKESLESLGYTGELFKQYEISLFNYQMIGMLLGGLLWGIWGDKKGRITVLFGSILLYSVANIANAFVTDVNSYAICRFIAGVGLAGELGAGITLVAETMHRTQRGIGTMIIVTLGALGAVTASLVGNVFGWQGTYIIGGCLGLGLLALRAGTFESGMFKEVKISGVSRGNFLMLFSRFDLFTKFIKTVLIGLPIWYVIGILVALSNRFGSYSDVKGEILVSNSVMWVYIGLSLGDLLSGVLSQWFKNRRKVVMGYILFSTLVTLLFLYGRGYSTDGYYFLIFLLGLSTGYWALFVTMASEQFGTNIRSTVTTTAPNFIRGSVIPMTLGFKYLAGNNSIVYAATVIGVIALGLAFVCTWRVEETFDKDLDYIEIS